MNHHSVSGLAPKASKLLAADELVDCYFHLLCQGVLPPVKTAVELQALEQGYARLMSMMRVGYHPDTPKH